MKCFFDTSGLIKNYIEEAGTEEIIGILNKTSLVLVAATTYLESISTLRRLVVTSLIDETQYKLIKNELKTDFQYFNEITSAELKKVSEVLIEKYQLNTLDSIQLGSALYKKEELDLFVCCDKTLLKAASNEGLKTFNPTIDTI